VTECLVDECDQAPLAKSLCRKHYYFLRRTGWLPERNIVKPDPVEHFWQRVDKSNGPDACWPWLKAINGGGYGSLQWQTHVRAAHRVAYELTVGPIPDGLELDHTCHSRDRSCPGGKACRHRRCVNPGHLEPVPTLVNVMRGQSPHAQAARQTHCAQGHEFTPENTRTYPRRKQRVCLMCKRAAATETQRRKGAEHRREYMRTYRARQRASQP
jgi:hypothetical protein